MNEREQAKDPEAVSCPTCEAIPGAQCLGLMHEAREPHSSRVRSAECESLTPEPTAKPTIISLPCVVKRSAGRGYALLDSTGCGFAWSLSGNSARWIAATLNESEAARHPINCTCGADAHNARVDQLRAALKL